MRKFDIYSPWVIFAKKMEVMFAKDPEVSVRFIDSDSEVKVLELFVDTDEKAEALSKLLPLTKKFGNIEVQINIISGNIDTDYRAKYLEDAFKGNGAFSHTTTVSEIPGMKISNPITYCVFEKEVVQYGADDLGSESGMASTLYENLAREIFGDIGGVYFCTDVK